MKNPFHPSLPKCLQVRFAALDPLAAAASLGNGDAFRGQSRWLLLISVATCHYCGDRAWSCCRARSGWGMSRWPLLIPIAAGSFYYPGDGASGRDGDGSVLYTCHPLSGYH